MTQSRRSSTSPSRVTPFALPVVSTEVPASQSRSPWPGGTRYFVSSRTRNEEVRPPVWRVGLTDRYGGPWSLVGGRQGAVSPPIRGEEVRETAETGTHSPGTGPVTLGVGPVSPWRVQKVTKTFPVPHGQMSRFHRPKNPLLPPWTHPIWSFLLGLFAHTDQRLPNTPELFNGLSKWISYR